MKKLFSILLVIALVGLALPSFAANEPIPVIGKVVIPAGAQITLMHMAPQGPTMFSGVSFEEQIFYVNEAVNEEDGTLVGWLADGAGFKHACPVHGMELFEAGVLMITKESVDKKQVILTLF